MRLDHDIDALATRQHSLVAVWQLQALGIGERELHRLRRGRRWEPLTPRVLAATSSGSTPDRAAMAAVLDASPGAVLSHSAAASFWGAPGFRPEPFHTTRHRGIARRGSRLSSVHEVIDLMPHHVKLIRGIPVTSPARTVFDLAASCHPARLERVLDWFWNERLLDGAGVDRTVRELARRGRAGSTVMRELAAARGAEYVPPASTLERRFEQLLAERGLSPMRRQVDSGGEEWSGRVDFRDLRDPFIVEVHSERHHTSLVDRAADARRIGALTEDGFHVVVVWDTEVWHEPGVVADRIRRERQSMRAARAS